MWPPQWKSIHITVKELLPIVLACAVWGYKWKGESVLVYTDNAAVVEIINSGRSKDALAMHVMRYLFSISTSHGYELRVSHVEGKRMVLPPPTCCPGIKLLFPPTGTIHRPRPHKNPSLPRQPPGNKQTRLDLHRVEEASRLFFAKGLADSVNSQKPPPFR